jgi:hypothetical protein
MDCLFDISTMKMEDPDWVFRDCINRLLKIHDFEGALYSIIVNGGIGGDIDWQIHRWDEYTLADYGVGKFTGYRFYVGIDDHGCDELGEIAGIMELEDFKNLLLQAISFYIKKKPEQAQSLVRFTNKYIRN